MGQSRAATASRCATGVPPEGAVRLFWSILRPVSSGGCHGSFPSFIEKNRALGRLYPRLILPCGFHIGPFGRHCPGDHDYSDIGIAIGFRDRIGDLVAQLEAEGVETFRPVEGDDRDAAVGLIGYGFIAHCGYSQVDMFALLGKAAEMTPLALPWRYGLRHRISWKSIVPIKWIKSATRRLRELRPPGQ
jgi:hypothetical protein